MGFQYESRCRFHHFTSQQFIIIFLYYLLFDKYVLNISTVNV